MLRDNATFQERLRNIRGLMQHLETEKKSKAKTPTPNQQKNQRTKGRLVSEEIGTRTFAKHSNTVEREQTVEKQRYRRKTKIVTHVDGSKDITEHKETETMTKKTIQRKTIETSIHNIKMFTKFLPTCSRAQLIRASQHLNLQVRGGENRDSTPGHWGLGIHADLRTFIADCGDTKPWETIIGTEERTEQILHQLRQTEGGATVLWTFRELVENPVVVDYIANSGTFGRDADVAHRVWGNIIAAKFAFNAFHRDRATSFIADFDIQTMIQQDDQDVHLTIKELPPQGPSQNVRGCGSGRLGNYFVWDVLMNVTGPLVSDMNDCPLPDDVWIVKTDPAALLTLPDRQGDRRHVLDIASNCGIDICAQMTKLL
jgi:hypothetical protein